jgi:hypothetical protein
VSEIGFQKARTTRDEPERKQSEDSLRIDRDDYDINDFLKNKYELGIKIVRKIVGLVLNA